MNSLLLKLLTLILSQRPYLMELNTSEPISQPKHVSKVANTASPIGTVFCWCKPHGINTSKTTDVYTVNIFFKSKIIHRLTREFFFFNKKKIAITIIKK